MIDWKQPELANAAGLGLSTIVDFEKERRTVSADAIAAIFAALEAAGVQFLEPGDTAGGAGVALK
ncbi:XRE family transcriptional regulator [Devosia riboflavina]|uniref:XRE family transcriptional regulator n=1 Tax=Devosia riboflavina TaxID=46914 RepID=UPI003137F512